MLDHTKSMPSKDRAEQIEAIGARQEDNVTAAAETAAKEEKEEATQCRSIISDSAQWQVKANKKREKTRTKAVLALNGQSLVVRNRAKSICHKSKQQQRHTTVATKLAPLNYSCSLVYK